MPAKATVPTDIDTWPPELEVWLVRQKSFCDKMAIAAKANGLREEHDQYLGEARGYERVLSKLQKDNAENAR